ncbi:uncharacterized protein B0P05DRAFT_162273 [Gilbertella persicaria]|uniref:uncharacterized protein n=1 Tax=Gilbertella persicaria TaxID=101096 RepID=UPI00221E9033|nr:uncharacterized protein B0P05DRAFT_162273 [Gilbertella persicaria]KAI8073481.1 hypothetical protein B0P05DRAFT_162273 [Gilbertella persicaria]
MYSKLVEDTKKRNIIEEVQVFRPPLDGGLWECPFCHPDTVYRMTIAPAKQTLELKQTRELIKQHIELHQKDLLAQMNEEAESNYEKIV